MKRGIKTKTERGEFVHVEDFGKTGQPGRGGGGQWQGQRQADRQIDRQGTPGPLRALSYFEISSIAKKHVRLHGGSGAGPSAPLRCVQARLLHAQQGHPLLLRAGPFCLGWDKQCSV